MNLASALLSVALALVFAILLVGAMLLGGLVLVCAPEGLDFDSNVWGYAFAPVWSGTLIVCLAATGTSGLLLRLLRRTGFAAPPRRGQWRADLQLAGLGVLSGALAVAALLSVGVLLGSTGWLAEPARFAPWLFRFLFTALACGILSLLGLRYLDRRFGPKPPCGENPPNPPPPPLP